MSQDVIAIMRESLYDKYVDEHGFVDFTRSGGMSQQKELRRLLNALNKQSELQQKDCFSRAVRNYVSKIVLLKSSWSASYYIILPPFLLIRSISFLKS
jgi:DNA helicase MCM8